MTRGRVAVAAIVVSVGHAGLVVVVLAVFGNERVARVRSLGRVPSKLASAERVSPSIPFIVVFASITIPVLTTSISITACYSTQESEATTGAASTIRGRGAASCRAGTFIGWRAH